MFAHEPGDIQSKSDVMTCFDTDFPELVHAGAIMTRLTPVCPDVWAFPDVLHLLGCLPPCALGWGGGRGGGVFGDA